MGDKVSAWHLAGFEALVPHPAYPSHEGPRQGPDDGVRVGASPNPWAIVQDWVTTGHHMGDRSQHILLQEAGKKKGKTSLHLAWRDLCSPGGWGHGHQWPQHLGNPTSSTKGVHHHGRSVPREEQADAILCCPSSSSPAVEEGKGLTEAWIRPE